MSARFTKIDDLTRPQHRFLDEGDVVVYLGEYTVNGGYKIETNSHILNLKMSPTKQHTNPNQFRYKSLSIDYWAAKLRSAVAPERVSKIAWFPIPCSKPVEHEEYDDRLPRLLRRAFGNAAIVLNAISQRGTRIAAHDTGDRPDPARLMAGWDFQPLPIPDQVDTLAIFDDVITRGASYNAARQLLRQAYPGRSIEGVFLARAVHDSDTNDLFSLFNP